MFDLPWNLVTWIGLAHVISTLSKPFQTSVIVVVFAFTDRQGAEKQVTFYRATLPHVFLRGYGAKDTNKLANKATCVK